MGSDDKLRNTGEEHLGKAKEQFGKASGDEDLQAEGKADQSKANLKQAGEKVKDAFKS
ncbi:MAG: CsbD family protein [Actinomycetota bacterium]|nr:CsbD family protein [Actinomycetota bacterium]